LIYVKALHGVHQADVIYNQKMQSLPEEESKTPDGVRAVDRALDILLAFRPGEGRIGAGELLKRVELSRPTLYRLLRTLEQRGFVVASGEPQRFGLGPAMAQLSQVWSAGQDLTELARPVMQQLWEATNETVGLVIHSGVNRVCVAEMPSPQPLSFKRGVGHSERVTLGASGRVILAFLPDASPYLQDMPRERRKAYVEELARVRSLGCAVSREELITGAVAMAVPVFMDTRVVGALAVYGPSARIDEMQIERILQQLKQASAQITHPTGL
jgi:IclR family transcriptional regulator, acetate operon repressor